MKVSIDRTKLGQEELTRLDELEALAKQYELEPEPEPELPDTVKKELADQKDIIAKKDAENVTLREEIAKRDEAIAKDAFTKAEAGTIPALPGTVDEKGLILYTLSKALAKDDYAKVMTLLKAGDAALAVHVSAASETGSVNALVGTSAMDQITEMAKQKVTKGEATTIAAAIDLVTREHSDLAYSHLRETRSAAIE